MRYIGSKKLLLEDIEKVINENIHNCKSFCDIFSGTATVANYFKKRYQIFSNDFLYFSFCIQKAKIENQSIPKFNKLKYNPIDFFNNLSSFEINIEKSFCLNNYSPIGKRMYLTQQNASKIDFIREQIEIWKNNSLINQNEYYYLIACLIEAIPYISNISGTYGAYNKIWDRRAQNSIKLKNIEIHNNNKENYSYNKDSNVLIKEISGDILYIDPPYNKRQYSTNYHLLETVALWDFPKLKGITGQRKDKIKKSLYSGKKHSLSAFDELIKNANFKHIIVSYSTEGVIKSDDIEKTLKKYGIQKTYRLYEIPYKRFNRAKNCENNNLKELLFYIRKEL